jgi:hypothetical protein
MDFNELIESFGAAAFEIDGMKVGRGGFIQV